MERVRIHPEIEDAIKENARRYLARHLQEFDYQGNVFIHAAEDGAVTFDELYFNAVCNGAGQLANEKIEGLENITQSEARREVMKLVGPFFDISPEEAERRSTSITNKIVDYMGKKSHGAGK